jgi:uracil-DNA glycosylase family 4
MNRFRILNRPDECLSCSLNSVATGFSEPEGHCTNGVLVVGDSIGWNEAVDGFPFRPHAQAGNVLEKAFKKCGYDRRQFALWNICACRPPSDSLEGWDSAIEHCRIHFRRVVARYRPKVILALGAVAVRSLTKLVGQKLNLEYLVGYPLWCEEFQMYVVAAYHPSTIARGAWNLFPVLCRDIKKAVKWAHDGVPQQTFEAIEDGTERHGYQMLEELQDCPDLPLSFDIEDNSLIIKKNKIKATPEVTQINLAVSERSGLILQPSAENMQTFRRMLMLDNMKIGQNVLLYDIPELENNYGFTVNGVIDDVMWRFHHLHPDLPMKRSKKDDDDNSPGVETDASELSSIANLQYIASFADFPFPWKHYNNERPGFYGSCDCIAPLMIYWWLRERMEGLGIETGYQTLNVDFNDCLKQMRRRGIFTDIQVLKHLHKFLIDKIGVDDKGVPTGTGLTQTIQDIVPDVCRNVEPKLGYKKTPKNTSGMVLRQFHIKAQPVVKCKCFRVRKLKTEDQEGFGFLQFVESEYAQWEEKADGKRVLRAPDPACEICGGTGAYSVEAHTEMRWARLVPFNVDSSPQMWNYAKFKKYRVPMNAKKKYAMDQETIAKLAKSTGDPLYVTSDLIRRYGKLDSTYALGWLNNVGPDGCVHPQIGDFTSIKQLASRNPNSQNVPSEAKNPELAPMFRRGIAAPDGRVAYECVTPETRLLTWDLKWVRAGDITTNHELLAFDEYPTGSMTKKDGGKRFGRKLRKASVQVVKRSRKQCVTVITDKGVFTCSINHSVVMNRSGYKGGWRLASELKPGMEISFLTEPWQVRNTPVSNYIAGFMDGEGFVGQSGGVGFGQNNGELVDYIVSTLECLGYDIWKSTNPTGPKTATCHGYAIKDERAFTGMRFIGEFRPRRLLKNYLKNLEGRATWGKNSSTARVIAVVPVGLKEVMSIQTSTRTYISEGFLSHNCDFKGFHNQTLGYEAASCMGVTQLSPFLRLAKIDIHTYFATQLLKIPGYDKCLTWCDDELLTWLKWHRKNFVLPSGVSLDAFRNAKAKHALHGYGNGLKAPGLYRRYSDNFENLREAEWVIDMLDATFPEVAEFHKWAPLACQRGVRITLDGPQLIVNPDGSEETNAVITRYNCIRWFYNIKKYDFKHKKIMHGEDWERAMCYPHTNDAHCHIRLVMMRLEAMGVSERFWMANQVHDALWFFPLKKDLEECHHIVSTEMARPSEVMLMKWDNWKGLSVEVDAKFGPNFGEMEKIG